jgi:hypothetical protein
LLRSRISDSVSFSLVSVVMFVLLLVEAPALGV